MSSSAKPHKTLVEVGHSPASDGIEFDEIRERLLQQQHEFIAEHREPRRRAADHPTVSLVVPAINEAENLPTMFSTIPSDVCEVVLVVPSPEDPTVEVALSLRDDVRVIVQEVPGKGNALIAGFNACRGDVIVMLDADCSMDAAEIPLFVDALVDGADFVKGSRYLDGGGSADITPIRSAGNIALRDAVNVLYGTRYTELCYGYMAFWRSALEELRVDAEGFEVETLMSIRAKTAGLEVAEVPSMEYPRLHGESNLHPVRDGMRILHVIVREKLNHRPHRVLSRSA